MSFSGFPPELYEFLVDLSLNNRRDWFDANKDRYEAHVRGPALAFVLAMGGPTAHSLVRPEASGRGSRRGFRPSMPVS